MPDQRERITNPGPGAEADHHQVDPFLALVKLAIDQAVIDGEVNGQHRRVHVNTLLRNAFQSKGGSGATGQ